MCSPTWGVRTQVLLHTLCLSLHPIPSLSFSRSLSLPPSPLGHSVITKAGRLTPYALARQLLRLGPAHGDGRLVPGQHPMGTSVNMFNPIQNIGRTTHVK